MKKDLHPAYHPIKVVMTDGTEYFTRSTWGDNGARLQLVIDSKNHPAYTGERKVVDSMGRMEKFRMKYAGGATAKPAAKAPAAAEETSENA